MCEVYIYIYIEIFLNYHVTLIQNYTKTKEIIL